MSTILDRYGMTYANALALQKEHLDLWHDRLKFDLICKIEEYCLATNKEAADSTKLHRVYRGSDLAQIILDWPDLKPCYAPAPKPEGTVEVTLLRDVQKGDFVRATDFI